jgi:uncharacterized phage protein (TIGR01671 family)
MRKVEFRGKRKDNGKWIYGDLIRHYSMSSAYTHVAPHISYYDRNGEGYLQYEVIPESIGEFTGQYGTVKGKSKQPIFEGDIQRDEIEFDEGDERHYYVCRYLPEIAAFVWMSYGDTCTDWETSKEEYPTTLQHDENYVICGNEFDNPNWWKKD